MGQPQSLRDRVPAAEWETFRRCRFVPRTFRPYPCLAALDGGGWVPYRGQPFDPAAWELVERAWDHEHCDVCSARIDDGMAYWANDGPEHVDLCAACYPLVRDALNKEGEAVSDEARARGVVIGALDVRARVEELKLIRHGWLDGKGLVPPPAALDWITAAFEERYPDDLRLPYLFPTPAGQVLAEWPLAPWSLSLELDPVARRGFWHALNLDTDEEAERDLDLESAADWGWLAEQIRATGGVAE